LSETVEVVEATTIDTDVARMGDAARWLSDARSQALSAASEHVPHPIRDDADYKASKKARAQASAEYKRLDEERKSLTRDVERAIKAFKSSASDAIAPLSEVDSGYRRYIDEWEAKCLREKTAEIQTAYEEFAPDLVPFLSFVRVWDMWAAKGKWANRTTPTPKAIADMQEKVEGVAKGYRAIDEMDGLGDSERQAVKAAYFDCLDVGEALARVRRDREMREAVGVLESVQDGGSGQPEPAREPAETPSPAPQPAPAPEPREERCSPVYRPENRLHVLFRFDSPVEEMDLWLTDEDAHAVRRVFSQNGIHGNSKTIGRE
jgi:hypothetical protein